MANIEENTRASQLTKDNLKSKLAHAILSEAVEGNTLHSDGYELNEDSVAVDKHAAAMLQLSDLLRTEIENLRLDMEEIHAYLVDAFGRQSDSAASQ